MKEPKSYQIQELKTLHLSIVKGECTRPEGTCPFRHEMPPPESDLSKQNIKDRYFGTNDPVANKILGKGEKIPVDNSKVTNLYISGVGENVTEKDFIPLFRPCIVKDFYLL